MRIYSEYTKLSENLSVVEGPGDVLLVGTPSGTYAYLSKEQEEDPKYHTFYPRATFKRFVPLETNIHTLPNIPTQASQKRWQTKGCMTITHVLRSDDDKVRLAFGGKEDKLPILVIASQGFKQYNNIDPGVVLSGYDSDTTGRDVRIKGMSYWESNASKLCCCTAKVEPDRDTEWGKHLSTTYKSYLKDLNDKRASIAEKLFTGELKRGNVGIFKVLDGLFYYDDTTTLKVLTEGSKKSVYGKLSSVTTDSFYEALYAICEPSFLMTTLGYNVPLELDVSGTTMSVEVRQSKARADGGPRQDMLYINGKRVTMDDYRPVIERVTCYPAATDSYSLYVDQVSRISLYYHSLNENGMPFLLGRAVSGNNLLAQAYIDLDTPKVDRKEGVPEVSATDYVFPVPEYASHGGGQNGHRGGSTFSLNIKFRKQKSSEKPQIFILGKWRTLLKGSSVVKSMRGFLASDGSSNFGTNRTNLCYNMKYALEGISIKRGQDRVSGNFVISSKDLNTMEHNRIAEKFSLFRDDSNLNGGFITQLVSNLYLLDSAFVGADRIFAPSGVTKGVDLTVPTDDIGRGYHGDVVTSTIANNLLNIVLPWWERVIKTIISPLAMQAADQVVAVGDALKKSEEILLSAIKQTGAEHSSKGHANKKHYVKVTGHSGMVYWICVNDGNVSLNKANIVEGITVDSPGKHICIVRASNAEYAGHDYVASLVFALHSDSRTAKKIYTIENLLKK